MRFAGSKIQKDPSQMKYTATRFAASVAKENPGLVERITDAIVPGKAASKSGETN